MISLPRIPWLHEPLKLTSKCLFFRSVAKVTRISALGLRATPEPVTSSKSGSPPFCHHFITTEDQRDNHHVSYHHRRKKARTRQVRVFFRLIFHSSTQCSRINILCFYGVLQSNPVNGLFVSTCCLFMHTQKITNLVWWIIWLFILIMQDQQIGCPFMTMVVS